MQSILRLQQRLSAIKNSSEYIENIFVFILKNYPLQSYLRTIAITLDTSTLTSSEQLNVIDISDRTFKAAQVFLAAIPVLMVWYIHFFKSIL